MLGIRSYLVAILVAAALAGRADANDIRYTITDLGVLSGAPSNGGSHPTAMNDLGQVCGYGDTTVATSSGGYALADHAWLYTGSGASVHLGAFGTPSDSLSIATALNNSGMVCGYSDSSDPARSTRAFVYTQAGGMQDLPIFPGGRALRRTSTTSDKFSAKRRQPTAQFTTLSIRRAPLCANLPWGTLRSLSTMQTWSLRRLARIPTSEPSFQAEALETG